ncbi:MAG: alpha/beta fold hydrolase [Pseudomonadota bacterium]
MQGDLRAFHAIESEIIPKGGESPQLEILNSGERGAKTPILFLHGYTSGAWQFAEYIMPSLARDGWSCWALNLRGHGRSEGRDQIRRVRFGDYAADVERAANHVLEHEGSLPVLVGHSLGSVLARDFASRHKIPGLALASFGDIKLGMRDFMGWMMGRFPLKAAWGMFTGRPSALFAEFTPQYEVMYSGQPKDRVKANVERLMTQPDSDKVFMELGRLPLGAPIGSPPVLIISGDQDPIASPRSVSALAEKLDASPVILEGEAHDIFAGPNWHRAYEVLRVWLSEHEHQFQKDEGRQK